MHLAIGLPKSPLSQGLTHLVMHKMGISLSPAFAAKVVASQSCKYQTRRRSVQEGVLVERHFKGRMKSVDEGGSRGILWEKTVLQWTSTGCCRQCRYLILKSHPKQSPKFSQLQSMRDSRQTQSPQKRRLQNYVSFSLFRLYSLT